MLKVIITRRADMTAVVFDGHASAGNYGSDIVCASASMLAYTLAEAVKKRGARGMFTCEPIVALSPGSARIVFAPQREYVDELGVIVDVIADGYRMLAASYPDNVQFIYDATPERA